MEISAVCEKKEIKEAIEKEFPDIHVYGTVLPYVMRSGDISDLENILSSDEVVARTIDELGFLSENSYRGRIIADAYLYTMNRLSKNTMKEYGVFRDTAPLEENFNELLQRGMENSELLVYGRIPLMVSAQCLYRNTHGDVCGKDEKNGHLLYVKDRTGRSLPCVCDCRHCLNVIYNSVPLSLHNHMEEVRRLKSAALRLYFTTETLPEARRIAGYYVSMVKYGKDGEDFPLKEYTTGHFKKGVE